MTVDLRNFSQHANYSSNYMNVTSLSADDVGEYLILIKAYHTSASDQLKLAAWKYVRIEITDIDLKNYLEFQEALTPFEIVIGENDTK